MLPSVPLKPIFQITAVFLILFGISMRFFASFDPTMPVTDGLQMWNMALENNQQGRIATHGLASTRGQLHGPMSIWILQSALLLTSKPNQVRIIWCTIHTLMALIAIVLLTYALKNYCLWEEVATIFVIPSVAFFSRELWDNPTPFTFLTVGAYLCFCRTSKWGWLCATAFAAALTINAHLMGISCVLAVFGHFLFYHRDFIQKQTSKIPLILLCFALPLIPYLTALWGRPTSEVAPLSPWFAFAWEQLNQGYKAISIGALPFGMGWRAQEWSPLFVIGEGLCYVFGILGIFWSYKKRQVLSDRFLTELYALSLFILGAGLMVQQAARLQPLIHYYHGCLIGYQLTLFLAWIRSRNSKVTEAAKIAFLCFNAWGIWLLLGA